MVRLCTVVAFVLYMICSSVASGQPGLQVEEAQPMLRKWAAPELPAELARQNPAGRVVIEFVVEADGRVGEARVADSTHDALGEPALAAVRQWLFEPGVRAGRPAAYALRVPIVFPVPRETRNRLSTPYTPQALPLTSPRVTRYGRLRLPESVERRQLGGTVVIECEINPEGKAQNPRVLATPSADFTRPALDALELTTFAPAQQGWLKIPATIQVPFEFGGIGEDRREQLAVNGIRPAEEGGWDGLRLLPLPLVHHEPVYPYEALLGEQTGLAEVKYTVTSVGRVRDVEVLSASEPGFGEALAAAVRTWSFRPALGANGNTETTLIMRHEFTPRRLEARDPEARLLKLLRGGESVGGARGLDAGIKPVYRVGAVLSPATAAERGEAEIEFIIDEDGRPRLPRIRRSSTEEFGWAAATAVAQWVFERPTREGQPTQVRVIVPMENNP
jgi:TonB family protein